jgi:diguanylate cyclase (GGDEF)-like protein/PAS domain S-box-containing protein
MVSRAGVPQVRVKGGFVPDADPDLARLLAWCVTGSDMPFTVVDATAPDMPLVYVNAAFEVMTGYQAGAAIGRNPRFLQGPRTDPAVAHDLGHQLREGRSAHARLVNYRADGTPFWNEMHIYAVRDPAGRVAYFTGTQRDVTTEVSETQKLKDAATRDPLTRLLNRTSFAAEVERELARAARHTSSVGLLFMDIDRFKSVNDTHGHHVGDGYLIHVAETLRHRLRRQDLAARHAGDEFTVLLTDLPANGTDAAAHVVADLHTAVAQPFTVDGVPHRVSVTIGTALFPRDGTTLRDLLAHADTDMYARKHSRPDSPTAPQLRQQAPR